MEDCLASALSTAGVSLDEFVVFDDASEEDNVTVEIENREPKVERLMDETERALWYLEQPVENFKRTNNIVDPLNIDMGSSKPSNSRRNYLAGGYKDPKMQQWEKVLFETVSLRDKKWFCKKCEYSHHRRGYILSHIEGNHPPPNFPGYKCLKCKVVVPHRTSFQGHISKVHGNSPLKQISVITNQGEKTIKTQDKNEYISNDGQKINYIEDGFKDPAMEVWDKVIKGMTFKVNSIWMCSFRDYKHNRITYVLSHIEGAHPPFGFPGYTCLKCHVVVKNRTCFQEHVSKRHKNDKAKYKDIQIERFDQLSNSYENVGKKIVQIGTNLHCTECSFSCLGVNNPSIVTHVITEHPEQSSEIEHDDPKKFDGKKHFSFIMESSEKKVYKCGMCDFKCDGSDFLRTHFELFHKNKHEIKMKTVRKEKKMKIPISSLLLAREIQESQQLNMDITKGEANHAPYMCKKCGSGYFDEKSYRRHMLIVEGIAIEATNSLFKCETCHYGFKDDQTMRMHMNRCSKVIKCGNCYRFIREENMNIHLTVCKNSSQTNEKLHYISSQEIQSKQKEPVHDEPNDKDLTLEEKCNSILDIIDNVEVKIQQKKTEDTVPAADDNYFMNTEFPSMYQPTANLTSIKRKLEEEDTFILNISSSSIDSMENETNLKEEAKELTDFSTDSLPHETKIMDQQDTLEEESKPDQSNGIINNEISVQEIQTNEAVNKSPNKVSFAYPMDLSELIKQEDSRIVEATSNFNLSPKDVRITSFENTELYLTCNVCNTKLPTKAMLGAHLLKHLHDSFICKQCDQTFTNIKQVRAHRKLHDNKLASQIKLNQQREGEKMLV